MRPEITVLNLLVHCMRRARLKPILAIAFLSCAAGSARAQVVQLPIFQFFGMSTTVSVPDRGGAYLGGVSRSSMGRFERGLPGLGHVPIGGRPFGNRGVAGRTQTSGVSVSAHIHDFAAIEEQLLGQASATGSRPAPPARVGSQYFRGRVPPRFARPARAQAD